MKHLLIGLIPSLLLLLTTPGQTQPYEKAAFADTRPNTTARQLTESPVLDGKVLEEAIWQQIPTIGELWQSRPSAGSPGSEKTEIRVAYNSTTFYVSVVCHDSEPGKLVVSDARRDAPLDNTDAFSFILDTYHDGQNGFIFGTNPIGVEYDAQVDNEGQGNFSANRQQTGTIGGFNLNWDASWQVKAYTGDFGWSAEFAIPFKTLRFAAGKNQVWGINFQRNIRKNNEIDYWAQLPIQFDLKRLSLAGTLSGLNLEKPGNLKLIPYVLSNVSRDYRADPSEVKFKPEVGADIKYSVTPSLTLDVTYNTDFAQVEVDEQQVNLDRFNLFFPEKRPFFLENAGLFTVGSPGEVDLFFSRRIGITNDGIPVPIIGGARLSGKVNRTNVGFLSMFTEKLTAADIQPNNFTVARVNHEFAQRSSVGAMFVNRQGMGEVDDDFNRTYAADGRWGLGKKAQLSGFYARTVTPGIGEDEHAFKLQSRYEWNGLEVNLAYTEVGEGFNPEVGFLQRSAFRKPEFLVLKRIRPNGKFGLLELRPHVSYRSYWNFDNFLVTSFLHVDNHWEFQNGMEIHTGINFTTEGVLKDFEISKGVIVPADSYHHREAQLVFFTNKSKPVYISTRHILGGFFGGKRYNNSITAGLRLGDKFNTEVILNRNDVILPGGDFNTNILATRLSYAFTPRIFTQSLIQYNSVTDSWSANIRFGWLNQANTGLFLVFNELHDIDGVSSRSFILKYSRMFDVLK
jgi:hypothetical protein